MPRSPLADGPFVVHLERVSKHYGPRAAVEGLNLGIRRGLVYGLLGPNGAGKTTTLRMLLGLVTPTAGTVRVLGHLPGSPAALARTGALVEEPALYPFLTGRDNLELLCRYGEVPRGRIDAVLDLVGLRERAHDKVRAYSLGMRQRLGVAAALLGDPELLILDEPTNGLDPQGMASMRALVAALGTTERTVIVSSHQLGEIEQVCDRVAVLNRGRLIAEDHVANLRGASILTVRATPPDRAAQVLTSLPWVDAVERRGALLDVVVADLTDERAAAAAAALVHADVAVADLHATQRSLEDVFFAMTRDVEAA